MATRARAANLFIAVRDSLPDSAPRTQRHDADSDLSDITVNLNAKTAATAISQNVSALPSKSPFLPS